MNSPPMQPKLADTRPHFTTDAAEHIASTRFGVSGVATALPSYSDQNFCVTRESGDSFVLKIANATEERTFLEAQQAALAYLHEHHLPVPHVCSADTGETLIIVDDAERQSFFVWMLSYIPGVLLATVNPQTRALLEDLGMFLGRLDDALSGFEHPGANRTFDWDLKHSARIVRDRLNAIEDAPLRTLVERTVATFEERTLPLLPTLRQSVIHNDANDFNVLVSPPATPERSIVGLIDFGDMVKTVTVSELAIACTYAMLDKPDPLAAAAQVVSGYHAAFPLNETETAALFPLIQMRICTSLAIGATKLQAEPQNNYLAVSKQAAQHLLEQLADVSPSLAHYTFRHACGLTPCPTSEHVSAWLREHRPDIAPIIQPDPRNNPVLVFDFSIESTAWSMAELTESSLASNAIFERIRVAEAEVGLGRYDEVRLIYTGDQFLSNGEARSLHIGMDLFQPAGAPIFAPLNGIVHSLADNNLPLDYGPTLILEHRPDDGPVFYTLYGHLSKESLEELHEGKVFQAGEQIATLGTSAENGGWAPHLHFQIICDLLGNHGNFPGVAPASSREVWRSLCPDPNFMLCIPEENFPLRPTPSSTLLKTRWDHLGPSLSLSYKQPLKIVRGSGASLYDEDGRAYLDCVNNVCHVGHCHPHVVRAGQQQMSVLNTNTRYLHDNIVRYAERLTALLPDTLQVCFFVNSGSEANDLALRLARTHTKKRDVVVLEGGYHGNLSSLIEISPYKFNGRGGTEAPEYVHTALMPDPYRGPYQARDPEAGRKYATHIQSITAEAAERGTGIGAFFAEPLLGCGGQIVPPEGYLQAAYRHIRNAGGVCIADEVQVGLGRVGSHFWGFETQGVVPDIVTMGKPMGNGHPLAAVVTTPQIAASFDNGMEYFNTFGGNPVSCAVGLAVLDVIEEEQLQNHALEVGTHLKQRLAALMPHHPIVGDVRGLGLFLGIELVLNRSTKAPASDQAAYVVERMKEHGILLSRDGPLHNVIKIKPPLIFGTAEADRLVDTLDKVLAEDYVRASAS